jgi:kynurenine 3-monooxygenase
MARATDLGERTEMLGHGYKELEIPPAASGPSPRYAIEPHALHIWPRGGYMCIALPNHEGSFTVTLFLPNVGPHPSFQTVSGADAAEALFREQFADALPLIPDLRRDFDAHPVGQLGTLYLDRWHLGGRVLLLGDASHAIVPFHGQGMNAGFEDAAALASMLAGDSDTAAVFAAFQQRRKPDADAIAAMALENYVEMRDSVADPRYLLKRSLGRQLAERAPTHFMSRYRMVTFTRLPYAYALQRGRAQDALMEQLLGPRERLDGLDLDAAVHTLRATLPPLPPLRG